MNNVDFSGIHNKSGNSRRVWVLFDENDEHYFVPKYNSASASEVAPKPEDIPSEYVNNAKIFHIAPFPIDAQVEMVTFLSTKNKIITLDPDYNYCSSSWEKEWKSILSKIDVFLPSKIEFDKMINNEAHRTSINEYKHFLYEFSQYYKINTIILKLGCDGVILFDHNSKKSVHYPSVIVNVVDCTGAGDSFAGGFCHLYKYKQDLHNSILHGLVSASLSIEKIGANSAFLYSKTEAIKRLQMLQTQYNEILNI